MADGYEENSFIVNTYLPLDKYHFEARGKTGINVEDNMHEINSIMDQTHYEEHLRCTIQIDQENMIPMKFDVGNQE